MLVVARACVEEESIVVAVGGGVGLLQAAHMPSNGTSTEAQGRRGGWAVMLTLTLTLSQARGLHVVYAGRRPCAAQRR